MLECPPEKSDSLLEPRPSVVLSILESCGGLGPWRDSKLMGLSKHLGEPLFDLPRRVVPEKFCLLIESPGLGEVVSSTVKLV